MSRAKHILIVVMVIVAAVPAVAQRRRRKPPVTVRRKDPVPEPVKLTSAQRKQVGVVVAGGNEFALDLYAQLAGKNTGNVFFSPMSIHSALAMTSAGARKTTAEQMSSVLHLGPAGDAAHESLSLLTKKLNSPPTDFKHNPLYELSVINALWGHKDYPFEPDFIALMKDTYDAGLRVVDFGRPEPVRKTINDWAANKTRQKILDLIPQGVITPRTRLVLTNAIYFKSSWGHPFKASATAPGEFRVSTIKTVRPQMMKQKYRFGYYEAGDLQALRLPYNRWGLEMIIILPRKDDGLAAVTKRLTPKNLAAWLTKLRTTSVNVTLPRFTFSSQFNLNETLKGMGMTEAFSMGADFSGMSKTKKKDLYITDVVHKAFVALDEQGTEAAAATAVMVGLKSAVRPSVPKEFKADHPFLFLIRHRETESILFMGRVTDPTAK